MFFVKVYIFVFLAYQIFSRHFLINVDMSCIVFGHEVEYNSFNVFL